MRFIVECEVADVETNAAVEVDEEDVAELIDKAVSNIHPVAIEGGARAFVFANVAVGLYRPGLPIAPCPYCFTETGEVAISASSLPRRVFVNGVKYAPEEKADV